MRRGSRYTLSGLLCCRSRFGAFRTRTKRSQEIPRVDAVLMTIVPMELDGVFPDPACGSRLRGWFEHRQCTGFGFLPLPGLAARLYPIVIAQRTRACVPEVLKRIVTLMAVLPGDVHTLASGEVNVHSLGICGPRDVWNANRHTVSIAQRKMRFLRDNPWL